MSEHNYLSAIFERRRASLVAEMARVPLEELKARALARRGGAEAHRFRAAVSDSGRVNVIAEFKRASPSKGEIRGDLAPGEVAAAYERGGARAVSVLTEGEHFRGSLADLEEVVRSAALPALRKDFIFDEYQVYEAAAAGADALLLIAAMLDDDALRRLRSLTEDELGMDALVEVHTADEMRRAGATGARLVGVNNRDLKTFSVSLDTSLRLAGDAPPGATLVSESGIRDASDVRALRAAGYAAFLVGETLMRAESPEHELRKLLEA